ncbi:MAG TPA: 16S rRNA (guanine(527)-N(7))-methyltransferase RsmG [Rhodocyclaceae bacterium]|nr:16S rRNA (guanine(527)-N(7))-methyltransferase RsmG [Rhodocyclaceae bacterium]
MSPRDRLHDGVEVLGLDLSPATLSALRRYGALLAKWNRTYNLTAIRDADEIERLHLLDALTVLPALADVARLADIGSGAGLPGIPIALCRPDMKVTLIESNRKKSAFLNQAKIELSLANVSVCAQRVEDVSGAGVFDAVICRAFADLATFVSKAGHLLASDGELLAMKGRAELAVDAELPSGWCLRRIEPLLLPGSPDARHLVHIGRASA